jgi:hypothetical protein
MAGAIWKPTAMHEQKSIEQPESSNSAGFGSMLEKGEKKIRICENNQRPLKLCTNSFLEHPKQTSFDHTPVALLGGTPAN